MTERGTCPRCGLFSVIRRDGTFVATRKLFTALDGDEPLNHGPLADVYVAAASGGAPLLESCRYDGFPTIDVCHAQLRLEFQRLRALLEAEIPDAQFTHASRAQSDPEWIATNYNDATELYTLTWDGGGHCIELVCCLTKTGGRIELLRDGKMVFNR